MLARSPRRVTALRLISFLWLVLITVLSTMPLRFKLRVGTTGYLHKPGHLLAFLVTTVIFCWAAASLNALLLRSSAICCFAVILEILEWLLYHNRMEWEDVLIDVLGVALGFLIVAAVQRSRDRVLR